MTTIDRTNQLSNKFNVSIAVKSSKIASIALAVAMPIALCVPVKALQVQMTPQSPRLGDTISVVVSLDNPASGSNVTVSSGTETYTAYEIAPNKYRAFIPTTPLEKPGSRTIKINGGPETKNLTLQVGARKFPVQRINLPPGKAGVKATELELRRAREFREVRTPEKFWQGAFKRPNQGRMSTQYGVRRYYNGVFANDYYHRGQDFAGASGSTVIAPAAGRVVLVGTVAQGFRVQTNFSQRR